jgi:hypothetical protein
MIEVFQTNVQEFSEAQKIVDLLTTQFPGSKINFDLDDCDKVLRVEGEDFLTGKLMMLVKENGFSCSVLD